MLSSTRAAPWSCAWNRETPTLKAPLVLRGSFEREVNIANSFTIPLVARAGIGYHLA